jgi:hypothetical protein
MTMTNATLRRDGHAGGIKGEESKSDPEPEVLERARLPRQYLAKYKAEILADKAQALRYRRHRQSLPAPRFARPPAAQPGALSVEGRDRV